MIEATYNPNEFPAQALVKLPLNDLPPADLIEEYCASERGDHRVIAALLTIERECAEIDQGTAPARKRDDGSGDGDGPPGTTRTRIFLIPDGTARLECDDGPEYVLTTEFATVSELVQYLLDYEAWARGNGLWIGPSYLNPNHPAYPIICMGLN